MFRYLFALCLCFALLSTRPISAEVSNHPKSHVIMGAHDTPLVVQEWGNPDGIPVIFLHGFGFGANSFKFQIGPITDDLRMIAPDLRGHGLSAKPWTPEGYDTTEIWADDLAAIMQELEIEKPVLVGWSFGGFVAMNYVRHYGCESVSGIVLVGSLAGLTDRPPPPDPAQYNAPPPKGNSRADNFHDFFENIDWLARVMTFEEPSQHLLEQKKMTLAMSSPIVKRAMATMTLDNRDIAHKVSAPVLFITGDKDGSVPASYIDIALVSLPNAKALLYKGGVGHSPFEERPERFNRDLADFARASWHAR